MAYPQTTDEEDFRSRYKTETVGMPAHLATVASRNLAAQDSATAKVNAISRLNPLPAPGSPYATPETDAANFSMADAMDRSDLSRRTFGAGGPTINDLHSDDISQRRATINEQKKQIQVRLGIIPPREAGLAAVVLAGPKERKDLLANWQMLEKADANLLREHQKVTAFNAKRAHETFARQKHIDADNDFIGLAGELSELRKTTKRGTPERADGIFKIVQKWPGALNVKAGQTLVRQMAGEQDAAATLVAPPGYETVPSNIGAGGKLSYDVKPEGTAERLARETEVKTRETELKDKYGLTLKDIKAPGNIESGNRDAEGHFVNANKGTHFRVRTKDGGEFIIPRKEFEDFGGHIGPTDKIEAPAQFDTEESARAAGRKTGEIVLLKNPTTGKYQRARLD